MSTITTVTSSCGLKWPENLAAINITEAERDQLDQVIISLQKQIKPDTETCSLRIFHAKDLTSPRRLDVSNSEALVVLKGVQLFGKTGAQQKKIKRVWDCVSGSFWLQKRIFSSQQPEFIKYLINGKDIGESNLGFPKMALDSLATSFKAKLRYFEKEATASLPEWIEQFGPYFDLKHTVGLLDALRKIHSTQYQPAKYERIHEKSSSYFAMPHKLFHGDISPNNVICEKTVDDTGKIYPRMMLTDFSSLGQTEHLYWTPGWESPETRQFSDKTKYQSMSIIDFQMTYGAKKDTWAMGLLLGSLIRGQLYKQSLPYFSFILNKLKFDDSGNLTDSSGIANITQKEIDDKLDELISQSSQDLIQPLYRTVKAYLRVDPDERPTLTECFIGVS